MIVSDLRDLAGQRFNVITADPPWMYQKRPGLKSEGVEGMGEGVKGIAEREYPTMTNEELAAMPIRDLAADDAHLFMWFTNPGTFGNRFSDVDPEDIARAWGFEFRTILTWVKTAQHGGVSGGGMGWYFRGATEHVLYATRGKAKIESHRREPNVIMAPARGHSVKPHEFIEKVERACDGPYLELFARRPRDGWTVFGNQIPEPDNALDFAGTLSSRSGGES